MAQFNQFISVLDKPTTNGNITITITSYGSIADVNLSRSIAVLGTDTVLTTAKKLQAGIATLLTANSADYTGIPTFSTEPTVSTFKQTLTDHVICLWSQAQFDVTVDVAATGATVVSRPNPVLLTTAEFTDFAAICQVEAVDLNGNALSTSQVSLMLQLVSDEVVNAINNPIVLTTNLHQVIGNGTTSVQLKVRPVISFDPPHSRHPGPSLDTLTTIGYSKESFRLNSRLGTLSYSQGSLLVDVGEPFSLGNEVLVTYTAGNPNIPLIVKKACTILVGQMAVSPNLKMMKAADFAAEFFSSAETIKFVRRMLGAYML